MIKPKSARHFARERKIDIVPPAIAVSYHNVLQQPGPARAMVAADPAVKLPSKISGVIGLLERSEGATLNEMVTATGWLAHTTRAALTGLKKKGHVISRGKRGDVTCYFIPASAA